MSLYKKYQEAWDGQDIGAMLELYHPDYKRVFHAKGIEQGLDDLEPIICTPTDAFKCLMGTEMDLLAVGNFVLYKEKQDEELRENYEERYGLD